MLKKLDDAFRFEETALRLRSERQQMLATNIANADTPGYKAKDIDFSAALSSALAQQQSGQSVTHDAHLAGQKSVADAIAGVPVVFRKADQASADGNTVDMDVERGQYLDNAIRYEADINRISGKIKSMLTVLQG